MMKIVIECSEHIDKIIREMATTHSIDIVQTLDEYSVLIKEISKKEDIEQLASLKQKYGCHVICIVSNSEMAFEVIATHPLNTWRKDNIIEDSKILMSILHEEDTIKSKTIEFKANSNTIVVNTKNIVYLESYSHYLTIHTRNSSFRIRENISSALSQLEEYGFIQIHKSYLVNKLYIKKIETDKCILSNEVILSVGKKYRKLELC